MEKKIKRKLENGKTVSLSQNNCRYTLPTPAENTQYEEGRDTSYIETAISEFILTVFERFMPLYENVYKSKYKAKVEITTMRKLTKEYMDATLSIDTIWHPDKIMEWMSTSLHWLLNCSRTFDYQEKLMDRGDEHPLDEKDFKKILRTIDVKPFKTTNICRFEELRDGYKRMYSREYKYTTIRKFVNHVTNEGASGWYLEPFIEHLKNSMMSRLDLMPKEYGLRYAHRDRRVTADVLMTVSSQFQRIIKCMTDIYNQYQNAFRTAVIGEHASQVALWRAANSFKHNKTVSETIDGYYYANKYGAYRDMTVNMVNNAVTAMKMRDRCLIDESDFPLVIDNGN